MLEKYPKAISLFNEIFNPAVLKSYKIQRSLTFFDEIQILAFNTCEVDVHSTYELFLCFRCSIWDEMLFVIY